MIEYLIVLAMGIAAGYLIGSAGCRYQRNDSLQSLIDIEATRRKADGLYRRGDLLTETEPVECGVIRTRELSR